MSAERALIWGVKASLLGYVRGMPDGSVEVADGASEADGAFRFPAGEGHDPFAFHGTVRLTGHGGMMRVTITDPSLVQTSDGWVLQIADPDEPALRLRFATITRFDSDRATGTALTEDGADLFFGPYAQGTPVDDPHVER